MDYNLNILFFLEFEMLILFVRNHDLSNLLDIFISLKSGLTTFKITLFINSLSEPYFYQIS